MIETPEADAEESDIPGHLYTEGPVTSAWAERVYAHQVALIRNLKHGATNALVNRRAAPAKLPWTLEDLEYSPGDARRFTTKYRGVVKQRWRPGYLAYTFGGPTTTRRRIGAYDTKLEAAYAVLYTLNPNARPNPNGDLP